MTKRIIRYSEIRNYQDCKRSWLNGYFLGLRTPEFDGDRKPTKAETGTYCHADLESYYNGMTERPGDHHRQQTPVVSENYQKEWDKTFVLAQTMLDGYAEWLESEGMDMGERTTGTEVEIEMPMGTIEGDDVWVQMHVDRIVLDTTFDRCIIEDTKTVDSLDKDLTFAVESQLLTYTLGVQKVLGLTVAECRHNMLRRVLRTARATPPFYGRVSMNPSAQQLESHQIQLRGILTDMVRSYQALEAGGDHRFYAPAHPTRDCSWKCRFLPICAMHDDGSDLAGVRQALYITPKKETSNV